MMYWLGTVVTAKRSVDYQRPNAYLETYHTFLITSWLATLLFLPTRYSKNCSMRTSSPQRMIGLRPERDPAPSTTQ